MVSEKEIHQSRDLLKRTHVEEWERGEGGIENKNPFCESVKQTDKQKVKREKRKFFVLIHKWCSSSLSYSTRLQENTTFFLLRNCFSLRYCVLYKKYLLDYSSAPWIPFLAQLSFVLDLSEPLVFSIFWRKKLDFNIWRKKFAFHIWVFSHSFARFTKSTGSLSDPEEWKVFESEETVRSCRYQLTTGLLF